MNRTEDRFDLAIDPRDIDPDTIARLVAKGRRERSRAVHAAFASLFRRKDATETHASMPGHAAPC
jgi:hypothetical protein